MLHRLYGTSPLTFRPTAIPTPTVYIVLFEGFMLWQFMGKAPWLGQARGPGAAATSPYCSCKIKCQQVGCVVQRIQRRPKNTLPERTNKLIALTVSKTTPTTIVDHNNGSVLENDFWTLPPHINFVNDYFFNNFQINKYLFRIRKKLSRPSATAKTGQGVER